MSWTLFAARAGAREAGRAEREMQAGGAGLALVAALAYTLGKKITGSHDFFYATAIGALWIFVPLTVLGLLVLLVNHYQPGRPIPPAQADPARENALDMVARLRAENGE